MNFISKIKEFFTKKEVNQCVTCGLNKVYWETKPYGVLYCPCCRGNPLVLLESNTKWKISEEFMSRFEGKYNFEKLKPENVNGNQIANCVNCGCANYWWIWSSKKDAPFCPDCNNNPLVRKE